MKKTIIFILIFGFFCGGWGCVSSQKTVNNSSSEAIQGAWELYKDDDKPDQPIPYEKLYIYEDGRLFVDSSTKYYGFYELIDNQFHMILSKDGYEVKFPREFLLNEQGLLFVNSKKGYAYYKKTNDVLPSWKFEDLWETKTNSYISMKVPTGWKIHSETPDETGHQRLMLNNADSTKMIFVVRVPQLTHLPEADFLKVAEELINSFLNATPMAGSPLKKIDTSNFCGINGTAYISEKDTPPKWTVNAVCTKTDKSAVFIILSYHVDQLKEINRLVRTIEVDDIKLSTE